MNPTFFWHFALPPLAAAHAHSAYHRTSPAHPFRLLFFLLCLKDLSQPSPLFVFLHLLFLRPSLSLFLSLPSPPPLFSPPPTNPSTMSEQDYSATKSEHRRAKSPSTSRSRSPRPRSRSPARARYVSLSYASGASIPHCPPPTHPFASLNDVSPSRDPYRFPSAPHLTSKPCAEMTSCRR